MNYAVYDGYVAIGSANDLKEYRDSQFTEERALSARKFGVHEEDIRDFELLTRAIREQHDIPKLNVNMLMLPDDQNRIPAALINYNKVDVGELIPDTEGKLRLIGLTTRGIAIDVEGERYYYPK